MKLFYRYVLIVFFSLSLSSISCNRAPQEPTANVDASGVEVPEIEKKCKTGACVPGQWETAFRRFALTAADGLNLRRAPSRNSRIIVQLPLTRKVTILYMRPETITIGWQKGRWAFVQDSETISRRGWVFDAYLIFRDSFEKVQRCRIKRVRIKLGEKEDIFRFKPDGTFTNVQKRQGMKDNTVHGELFRYKKILWLKKEKPDDYPVFLIEHLDGSISLQDQYRKGYIGVVR